jgi:hypothetical protein
MSFQTVESYLSMKRWKPSRKEAYVKQVEDYMQELYATACSNSRDAVLDRIIEDKTVAKNKVLLCELVANSMAMDEL